MSVGFVVDQGKGWYDHGSGGNKTMIFDPSTKKFSSDCINWSDGFSFNEFDTSDDTNKGRLEQNDDDLAKVLKNTDYKYDKGFYKYNDNVYLNFGNGVVVELEVK